MTFDDINISPKMKMRLEDAATSGKIFHAYIFEGSACVDKEKIALSFIKAMLCKEHRGRGCSDCLICKKIEHGNYEDLIDIRAIGDSIKDEAVENMQERLRNKPIGERNIAIIVNADMMTLRAQNRLLKTLEEPPAATVIILLSENAENLIATIRSRCIIYRFSSETPDESEGMLLLSQEIITMLAKGEPFYSLTSKLKVAMEDKASALEFLDAMEMRYGLILKENAASDYDMQQYIFNAIRAIEEARKNLHRNMGIGYALKCLILKIGG